MPLGLNTNWEHRNRVSNYANVCFCSEINARIIDMCQRERFRITEMFHRNSHMIHLDSSVIITYIRNKTEKHFHGNELYRDLRVKTFL